MMQSAPKRSSTAWMRLLAVLDKAAHMSKHCLH